MRVLNFITSLSGGGAERQLGYLAPELIKLGHTVHIAHMIDGPLESSWPGVELHRIKFRSNYDIGILIQLIRIARKIKPDIIQTWNLQTDIIGGMAAFTTGIPWIIREASSSMNYPRDLKRSIRIKVGSRARAIIANSQGGMQYWQNKLPSKNRKIIRNGLPTKVISQIEAKLPPSIGEKGIPVILYVGRLEYQKRVDAFLQVLAYLKPKMKVLSILCGDGSMRSELESLSKNLGLSDEVHFTGYLPSSQIWGLMKYSSVFVSPSLLEGCPNTVMEAMACGCPIVVSDIPAHHEILDKDSAIFIDPSDVSRAGEMIFQLLANSNGVQDRVDSAKEKAQMWSVELMAENYETLYLANL